MTFEQRINVDKISYRHICHKATFYQNFNPIDNVNDLKRDIIVFL